MKSEPWAIPRDLSFWGNFIRTLFELSLTYFSLLLVSNFVCRRRIWLNCFLGKEPVALNISKIFNQIIIMRRLIFAAFFATAIVFPNSTYSSEKEFKVPNSDCLIAHRRLGKAPSFCDRDNSGCCCTQWHTHDISHSEIRKLDNGVCCTAGREKVCSGDSELHNNIRDGRIDKYLWVCEQ